ncbi:MAG: hypothetical protein GWO02_20715 [Gammaproteobacteria bacterium]|nr:hypothetical protein [Gammaproteobacteria bacterium]
MGDAATPILPDFTSQSASAYKANLDAGFAVLDRLAWAFAPHEQATPDMTVRLEAGAVFDGANLTEVAAQSTGTITAPAADPRIDRVVIDRASGSVSVVTGIEDPAPSPPAIPSAKVPVAQVALTTATTEITNAEITDERDFTNLGTGSGANQVPTNADVATFASGTRMLFQQTSAPTGWTKQTADNDKALRIVSGAAGSGGATAFSAVFGAGKTTGAHTLTTSEIASHSHNQRGYATPANAGGVAPWGQENPINDNNLDTTGSTGGGGSHDHTLSLDLQYVDVIIASKD